MSPDPARMIATSAREFADPAERAAYLDRVCRGIARLRADVERLLERDALDERASAGAAEAPAEDVVPAPTSPSESAPVRDPADAPSGAARADVRSERAGDAIDRYRLVRELGQGGFGTVWLAEQFEPVRRPVALKVIKLGMDTRQVVARFEQERQALALMDHPNVARVLDAGATSSGRPYFVMDLVQGEPIHEYCDRERLAVPQRLELFTQVCAAIQHAHMKGVIHRDLKPSNVLVGSRDGRPHATVIDFGIAKATSARLTDRALMTEEYQVIGTLQYMSPEQAQASPDIDTRTDVYSLGAILYELLAGSTPFPSDTFERTPLAEVQRRIREDDPAPPSSRITSTREILPQLAQKRRVDAARLATLVRGDLDWIVMKALEKDRARRYESAEALAADLRRHLAGDAVLAAPPSAGYRLRKFVRRNRGPVAAGAAVAAALVAGVIGFAWQAGVAERERDAAVKARESEAEQHRQAELQRDRALKAEGEAKARADELALVAEFQAGMLEQIDATEAGRALTSDVTAKFSAALEKAGLPAADRSEQVKEFRSRWNRVNATDAARDLVDRTILKPAIATIDRKFKDQPLVDAQLRQVLADRYHELGLYADATPLQTRALETRRRVLGEEDPLTLASLNASGALLLVSGRIADAEPVIRDVVEKRRRVLGADCKETAESLELLAGLLVTQGHGKEAESIAREVFAWREKKLGRGDKDTISALVLVAGALKQQGRSDESLAVYSDALQTANEGLGPDHRETLSLLNNLGTLEQSQGRLPPAERHFRDLLERRRRVSGEDHPDTLVTLGNLGFVLQAQGKLDEAAPLLRESLERRKRVLGEDHPITLYSLHDVGVLLQAQGKPADAESCFRRTWELRRRIFGDAHEVTRSSLQSLTSALVVLGRGDEATTLFRETLDRLRKSVGEDDEATICTAHLLGAILLRTSPSEAEAVLRRTVENATRVLGESSWVAVDATAGLCAIVSDQGRATEASRLLREFLDRRRTVSETALEPLVPALQKVAAALQETGDLRTAETLLRDEVRIRRAAHGVDDAATLDAINRLGVILQHQDDRSAEAEPLLREAYDGRLRTLGPDHALTLVSVRNLWIVLRELGRFAEAEPFVRRDLEMLRKSAAEDDPARAQAVDGLIDVLQGLNKHAEAESLLRDVLARRRKSVGDDAPNTVQAIMALARSLQAQGKLPEAEKLVREAIERVSRLAGPDAPFTCDCRSFLATLLWAQGRSAESVPIFEDLVAKIRAAAGPDHPAALNAAFGLAMSLRDAGRAKEAIPLFEDALQRARGAGPRGASQAAAYAGDYAKALLADGRTERAVAAVRDAVADARKRQTAGGLPLAQELVNVAAVLVDAHAWAEAEPLLREITTIRDAGAPDVWSTFNARALLGDTLLGQKHYAEAEPLVTKGYEGMLARQAQVPPQGRHWFEKGAARILRLYAEWDAAEPGKGHDRQLAEWKAKLAAPPVPAPSDPK